MKNDFDGDLIISDDILHTINSWIEEKTEGMIREIADSSINKMLFSLMNATVFTAEWEKTYAAEDITMEAFHNADDSAVYVEMLNSTEYGYIEDKSYIGASCMIQTLEALERKVDKKNTSEVI